MDKQPKNSRNWLITAIISTIYILFYRGLITKNIIATDSLLASRYPLVILILSILLLVSIAKLFFIFKKQIADGYENTRTSFKKNNASKTFITVIIMVFFIITIFGVSQILSDTKCASCNVYKAMGFVLIMVWVCIFLSYFIWAIYYYNLNLGKTNEEWAKIKDAKNNRSKGLPFNQDDINEEPLYNPYQDQTFGVPPGTVRGMIAISLLFGAIALLIVSFGMESKLESGSFFLDQFEFFKTAFLMMIAFYFGSHSLKYINKDNSGSEKLSNAKTKPNKNKSEVPEDGLAEDKNSRTTSEIIVIDSNAETTLPKDGVEPPIIAIDPMAPKNK